jgi:hypothetical protein
MTDDRADASRPRLRRDGGVAHSAAAVRRALAGKPIFSDRGD